jgi:hypothetical protein
VRRAALPRDRGCGHAIGDNPQGTVEQGVFAFMTTEPNELTASINHERMPVPLSNPDDFETWLSGSSEEAFELARSYAATQMRIVQSAQRRGIFWKLRELSAVVAGIFHNLGTKILDAAWHHFHLPQYSSVATERRQWRKGGNESTDTSRDAGSGRA